MVRDAKLDAVMEMVVGDLEPWDGVTRIYDPEGNEQDADWLEAWYGGVMPGIVRVDPVLPEDAGGYVMRCVALRTKDAECTQVVFVQDEGGRPLEGIAVARWWDSAQGLPEFPDDCEASRWYELGVYGITEGPEAAVGFGMGQGDFPPGSSSVWVLHCGARSDLVIKLGWAIGEAHRVVWPVFRVVAVEGEPEEPEEPEDGDLVDAVKDLSLSVKELAGAVDGVRAQLVRGWAISGR